MSLERLVAWCLFCVWCAWLFAFQGLFAGMHACAPWVPDMGVLLLLMLDRHVSRRDAIFAVLIVAAGRVAFSADPPLAILVGYGTLVAGFRLLRGLVEVDQPLTRTLYAGLATLVLTEYWALARGLALATPGAYPGAGGPWSLTLSPAALQLAASTAFCTLFFGSVLLRLPGLSPLWKSGRAGSWREAWGPGR